MFQEFMKSIHNVHIFTLILMLKMALLFVFLSHHIQLHYIT